MAKNYIQPGNVLTIPAPYTVAAGEIVTIGGILGIAAADAASGATVDVETVGVWSLPKVSADVLALGEPVFWDSAAKLATVDDDEGANVLIGYAVATAGNGAASVRVKLPG